MKKFFAAMLVLGILFAGCSSEKSTPQKQIEEKPTEKLEISAEEKAETARLNEE